MASFREQQKQIQSANGKQTIAAIIFDLSQEDSISYNLISIRLDSTPGTTVKSE